MLHIILLVLKIIGIIIATLLGLLLVTVCMVLFTPLHYRARVTVDGDMKSMKAKARFSWLFYLFAGYFWYENGKPQWKIRVLWKQWTSSDEKKTKEVPEKEEPQTKEKKSFGEKIKYTIQKICDMIDTYKEHKERLTEFITDEVHRSSWGRILQEVLRFLHFIKPKRLKANIRFGFEDPSITGKTVAALSILYPMYGDELQITPDFEHEILVGEAFFKGRVHGIHAFIVAWNLFFDENIRKTYKDIQNWKR